jgi:predicted transcriptional regulator
MTIVLPTEVLARVKRIAGRTATPPSVLVRQWIMER